MDKSLYSIRMEYWQESYNHWLTQEIFTFPWFFNIVFLLVLYVIWIKIVDKSRLRELLLYGALLSVASVLVDLIAVTIGLWEYNISLFPLSPAPFPFDFTVLPILYMIVLQYTSSWRNYFIGSLLAAFVFSFIIEGVYIWLEIKILHKFNLFYMFGLVLLVTTILKVIYNWIVSIETKDSGNQAKKAFE